MCDGTGAGVMPGAAAPPDPCPGAWPAVVRLGAGRLAGRGPFWPDNTMPATPAAASVRVITAAATSLDRRGDPGPVPAVPPGSHQGGTARVLSGPGRAGS